MSFYLYNPSEKGVNLFNAEKPGSQCSIVEGGTVEAFEAVALSCCFQSCLWLPAARYFLIFLTIVRCFKACLCHDLECRLTLKSSGQSLTDCPVDGCFHVKFVLRNLGNYSIRIQFILDSYCNGFMAEHNYPNPSTTRTT